jgi:phage antirepressor YoqD-like protein
MSQQDGISLRRFAAQIGVSEQCLLKWCRAGKVIGARKHVMTRKWVIYPPAKLALDALSPQSLRLLQKGGAA